MAIARIALLTMSAAALGLAACQTTETAAAGTDSATTVTYATGSRAAAEAAQTGEARVVCRRERVTGRLIAERICLTQDEWTRVEESGREAADNVERNSTLGPVPEQPGGF